MWNCHLRENDDKSSFVRKGVIRIEKEMMIATRSTNSIVIVFSPDDRWYHHCSSGSILIMTVARGVMRDCRHLKSKIRQLGRVFLATFIVSPFWMYFSKKKRSMLRWNCICTIMLKLFSQIHDGSYRMYNTVSMQILNNMYLRYLITSPKKNRKVGLDRHTRQTTTYNTDF